jgi:putative ABC transport system permease protein
MRYLLRIFYESASQAIGQLRANKLRTFLSLLGILIGILSIIGVKASIDSLQANIQESFEKLGKDMIYVDQFPWNEDPDQNFWKYYQRPRPDFDDYDAIVRKVSSAESASIAVIIPATTLKYKSSSVRGGAIAGVTYDYFDMYEMELDAGRYFTLFEYESAADKIILGYELAQGLFKNSDPIGKSISVKGRKMQVIGVIKKEGNSLLNIFNYDEAAMISYNTAKKIVNVKTGNTWGNNLNVKAKPGIEIDDLIEEVRGVLRVERRLKPVEDDDFSINTLSTITNVIQPIFAMMNDQCNWYKKSFGCQKNHHSP